MRLCHERLFRSERNKNVNLFSHVIHISDDDDAHDGHFCKRIEIGNEKYSDMKQARVHRPAGENS